MERENCSQCGKSRWIVNRRHMLCAECNSIRLAPLRKKQKKTIKHISEPQELINIKYYEMLKIFDAETPKVCAGCGKHEGTVVLSHSHIISRNDCKGYGMPELIYSKNNIQYLCLSIGDNHIGCHEKWENKKYRRQLNCYQDNINYISQINSKLYFKYKVETPVNYSDPKGYGAS